MWFNSVDGIFWMEWIDFEFNFIEALVVGTFTIHVYIYQAGVVMDGT